MNLGPPLFAAGKREEGCSHVQRAVALFKQLHMENTPQFALACHNLGCFFTGGGNPEKALPYLARALELFRRLLPPDHPDIASVLSVIALANDRQGNGDAAGEARAASAAVVRRSQTACAGPGCTRNVKADGRPLEQCGKCRRTYYCSVACQTADWKREGGHKAECKALVAEGLDPESGLKPLKPQS